MATGYRKPVCNISLNDCSGIISALLNYHLLAKVKAELDQFKEGLNTFGFIDIVASNPNIWKPYFVFNLIQLTPGQFLSSRIYLLLLTL